MMTSRQCFVLILVILLLALAPPTEAATHETDFAPVVARVKQLAQSEIDRGLLTGVSIALVDDQRTIFADGFGWADAGERRPATGKTVYRAGSISKLFTALAVMRLVEQGKLDLDAPLETYWPGFRIVVPFEDAGPITLRQLMCHRSGLVRESPVGGYFDPNEPSMADTVASLADCVLVHRPNTATKYSNIGVTVEGYIAAEVAGTPFAEYQREHVLGPLGMASSSFLCDETVRGELATSYMRVADGKGGFQRIESPRFELGTLSAGNLYTSAEDLGRFLSFLFAKGEAGGQQLILPETVDEMLTPQLTDGESGFGLGFHIDRFRDRKRFGHTGAVYGFSSSLAGIPGLKIGVIVLANEDITTGPVRKIAEAALGWMVDARLGVELAPRDQYVDVTPSEAKPLLGDFESESYWARIEADGKQVTVDISGQSLVLQKSSDGEYSVDGRWKNHSKVEFRQDEDGRTIGFETGGQSFHRVSADDTPEPPKAWNRFLGSYGPEFIPLVISIRHGHLYAMTENMVDYRLTPLNRTVFKMPEGMYEDEQLVFLDGAAGNVHSVVLAGMVLRRIEKSGATQE